MISGFRSVESRLVHVTDPQAADVDVDSPDGQSDRFFDVVFYTIYNTVGNGFDPGAIFHHDIQVDHKAVMVKGDLHTVFGIPFQNPPNVFNQVLRRQANHTVRLKRGLPGDGCNRILLDQDASQFIVFIF